MPPSYIHQANPISFFRHTRLLYKARHIRASLSNPRERTNHASWECIPQSPTTQQCQLPDNQQRAEQPARSLRKSQIERCCHPTKALGAGIVWIQHLCIPRSVCLLCPHRYATVERCCLVAVLCCPNQVRYPRRIRNYHWCCCPVSVFLRLQLSCPNQN